MIILRQRNYNRRDEFDEERDGFKTCIDYTKLNNPKVKITLSYSKLYNKQMRDISVDKDTIKKLKKDLLDGFLYTDGPNGGDTHFLRDVSKLREELVFSKCINTFDRLNYRIYKPIISTDSKTNNSIITIKVQIESCKGHTYRSGKTYSDAEE